MASFKKIGLDRGVMASQVAFGAGAGAVVTGDITRGTVVALEVVSDTTGSVDTGGRRTGALLLGMTQSGPGSGVTAVKWALLDSTLTLTSEYSHTGTYEFWVF